MAAARGIETLIGRSFGRVEAGSRPAGDAGATLNDIVVQVQRVAEPIAEIRNATVEQTQGMGRRGRMVGPLDRATPKHAALVEQSPAA